MRGPRSSLTRLGLGLLGWRLACRVRQRTVTRYKSKIDDTTNADFEPLRTIARFHVRWHGNNGELPLNVLPPLILRSMMLSNQYPSSTHPGLTKQHNLRRPPILLHKLSPAQKQKAVDLRANRNTPETTRSLYLAHHYPSIQMPFPSQNSTVPPCKDLIKNIVGQDT